MKRLPVISTLIVALAVAAMIALGVWQLERRTQKNLLLEGYAKASARPEMAYPAFPVGSEYLFRRASGFCLAPVSETLVAGYSRSGANGWRHIVACRTGAEGPGMTVDIGWSKGFDAKSGWSGGTVSGVIGPMPERSSVIERGFSGAAPTALVLVSTKAAAGLEPSGLPSPEGIPNNHLAYAVQWFLFAGIAAFIYALALRRRAR